MIFLYPYFLLLLLVPVALLFFKHFAQKNNSWAAVCDAHLLPFLTVQTTSESHTFYKRLMLAAWCLACICLAGPAILKKDTPTAFVGNGVVVVANMSPSMDKQAAEQMTRKLYDLLSIKGDTSFGLVLVDSMAYTALPITQDKSIFQNIIPDLKERIMPTIGQNIGAGIEKAETLLNQSGFKNGQILLITAGVADANKIANAIQKSTHPVHVIGVGNNEKHPVTLPNGQFWGGQTPTLVDLKTLSGLLGNQYNYATLDDSDLKKLLSNSTNDKIDASEYTVEQYQNLGIYGILLLLPLVALLFRRGVLLALLLCILSTPSYAGFWWRTEQELYQKQMQGVADFNIGQYENAQKQFLDVAPYDTEALYNLGTALAYDGKIEQAIATYEKVLAKNPNHEDAAYNLEYLKEQLPPPPPEQQQQSGENQNENQDSDKSDSSDENQQSENQQSTQSDDSDNAEGEQNQKSDSDETENQQSDSKENSENTDEQQNEEQEQSSNANGNMNEQQATAVPEDKQEQSDGQEQAQVMPPAQDQKQKEWLDQIKPNAGRVLRYRLLRQYQEQQ